MLNNTPRYDFSTMENSETFDRFDTRKSLSREASEMSLIHAVCESKPLPETNPVILSRSDVVARLMAMRTA